MTTVIEPIAPEPPATPSHCLLAPVRPGDREDVHRLFAACSDETVRQRFRARLPAFPARHLDELLAGPPERHDALAVRSEATGELVALGSLARPYGEADTRSAELGLLVVDAWQRRGIGRALTTALMARAARRGVVRIVAEVPHGRSALLLALGRGLTPLTRSCHRDGLTGIFAIPDDGAVYRLEP